MVLKKISNYAHDASKTGEPLHLNRWLAIAVVTIVAGMIPWTAYLAWSLPGHFRAHNWDIAWVGFDAGLIAVLAYMAWAAWFRRQILAPIAIVAATLLICDAWFDINTSFGTKGELVTFITAAFGNVPMAVFCILLARRIMLSTAAALVERGIAMPPTRHARDVTIMFSAGPPRYSHPEKPVGDQDPVEAPPDKPQP